tara:strand:- start:105 stop:2288 length:2184 start_codon:yes stop_codon:yes gene_type:complete
MNIIELQDSLKDVSDNVLMREMQSPSGNMPQFLVLSELTRRRRMRDDYKRQQAVNMPTVAEEVMTAAGAPQEGLTAIARNMAPNSSIAQNTGADMAVQREPTRMPQRMAEGGIVSMANGGPLGTYSLDRNPMDAIELLRFQRPDQYAKYKDNPAALERVALYYLNNSGIMPTEPEQTGLEGLEREPSFLEKFNPIPSLQAIANQTKIDQGQEARELEDRAKSLSRLRASAPEDGSSALQAQKYINDPLLDPSGGFSEPLAGAVGSLPESIIQARKMSAPELDFTKDPIILGGFDDDMSPVGTMPSQISEVITPEFDDYFQSPLLEYPQVADAASDLNASETAQEAADRRANEIANLSSLADLQEQDRIQQASDDYAANVNAELNRESSLEQPDKEVEESSILRDILRFGLPDSLFDNDYIKDLGISDEMLGDFGTYLGDLVVSGGEKAGEIIDAEIDKRQGQVDYLFGTSAEDTAPKIDNTKSSALDNISLGGESEGGGALSGDLTEFAKGKDTSIAPLGNKVVKTTTASATGGDSGTGYSDPLRSRIQRMLDEREKSLESDKWLALAQTGMALMASDNPTLAGAIGEAGLMGLRSLSEARQQYDDDILDLMNMQYKLDVLDQESTTSGMNVGDMIDLLDDLRDSRDKLQQQIFDLDDATKYPYMTDDDKQQRRLGIRQELFRTELRLSQIRKSLGLGGTQQAGNSFDVTGGTQTQSGLDLGTAVSA